MVNLSELIQKSGGPCEVSRYFGVSHTAIWKRKKSNQIPPRHVLNASKLFKIPPQAIRPDIFGKKEWTKGKGKS